MSANTFKVYSRQDASISLDVMSGHFVTPQSHITHYLDMTMLKSRCSQAQRVARLLAQRYELSTLVDTIVCLNGMETIGAFLAASLSEAGIQSINAHKTIYIVPAEFNSGGQLIFRDNLQPMIKGKHAVILMSSITTGVTLQKAIESVLYYGGTISGVSSVFSAANKVAGLDVNALFYKQDIPEYESYSATDCPHCKQHEDVTAFVNNYGYSKL